MLKNTLKIDLINPNGFELENGLPVTLAGGFCSARPFSAIVFLARCGLYTETDGTNGITHALEHILFKGSRKYSNYEITAIINNLGGSIDAFTTADSLGIEILIPHSHIEDALEVLSQLALKPAFPESEIELEKKVILEEMRFYRDDPEDLVILKLEKSCYKGSCYSREILGTPASVRSLDKKALETYHRDYFTPSNCSLTIAGCFDERAVLSSAEKHFGPRVWKGAPSPAKNDDYTGLRNASGRRLIRRAGKFTQSYYAAGFLTPSSAEREAIYSMFLPYVFSSLKSSPLLYLLKDEYNAVNGLTTDLVFKYGMWMLTVLASCAPPKLHIVRSQIERFIAGVSRFVSASYFDSIKKCFALDYMQEIENPRTYCGELSTFNHILGRGSYNHVVKTMLEAEYHDFINYLRESVEPCAFRSVELEPESRRRSGAPVRSVLPIIRSIEAFDASRSASGPPPVRVSFKRPAARPERKNRVVKLNDSTFLCVHSDASADYSSLSVFLGGGVSASFKPGDANLLAELFGRKTRGASMYENYMAADSRGIYSDCNSYLDYVKFDAVTPGGWTAEKLSYLASLFEGFDFGAGMLEKSRSSVRNMIRSIQDDVFELSFWGFLTSLFQKTPYARAVFANEKKIGAVSAADVMKYYRASLETPLAVIAVSAPAGCAELVCKNFDAIISRRVSAARPAPAAGAFTGRTFEREMPSRQSQCTIVTGSPAPAFADPESAAFAAANHILSDYAGKRLWNLRENHGLCYNIFSEYIPLGLCGAFFCYANASPEKAPDTVAKMEEEVLRFAASGPDGRELEDAKTQLVKRFENSASFPSSAARMAGQSVFYERSAEGFERYAERVMALTAEDVARAFSRYCRPGSLSRLKILPGS